MPSLNWTREAVHTVVSFAAKNPRHLRSTGPTSHPGVAFLIVPDSEARHVKRELAAAGLPKLGIGVSMVGACFVVAMLVKAPVEKLACIVDNSAKLQRSRNVFQPVMARASAKSLPPSMHRAPQK